MFFFHDIKEWFGLTILGRNNKSESVLDLIIKSFSFHTTLAKTVLAILQLLCLILGLRWNVCKQVKRNNTTQIVAEWDNLGSKKLVQCPWTHIVDNRVKASDHAYKKNIYIVYICWPRTLSFISYSFGHDNKVWIYDIWASNNNEQESVVEKRSHRFCCRDFKHRLICGIKSHTVQSMKSRNKWIVEQNLVELCRKHILSVTW